MIYLKIYRSIFLLFLVRVFVFCYALNVCRQVNVGRSPVSVGKTNVDLNAPTTPDNTPGGSTPGGSNTGTTGSEGQGSESSGGTTGKDDTGDGLE